MKMIWKFLLVISDKIEVPMPKDSKILELQVQGGVPCFWALVPNEPSSYCARKFSWYGTGHPVPDDPGEFIGTVQIAGLVFHLFEEPQNAAS